MSCCANHDWNKTKKQDFKKLTKDRPAFFRDIMQRWVVVLHRRFDTCYQSHPQGSRNPSAYAMNPLTNKLTKEQRRKVTQGEAKGKNCNQVSNVSLFLFSFKNLLSTP
jgi:hypothetical protein